MDDNGEQKVRPDSPDYERDEKGNIPWLYWRRAQKRQAKLANEKFMQEMDRMTMESLKDEEEFWETQLYRLDVGNEISGEAFVQWFWARCGRLGIGDEFREKFEEWKRSRAKD